MYNDILEALNTNCVVIEEMTDAINRAAYRSFNFKDDDDNIFIKLANDENTMCNDISKTLSMILETLTEMKDAMKRIVDNSESYTDKALKTLNKDVFEQKDLILNASLGLSGEVGEVNDIIKKYMYHGHKLDNDTNEKIILELGDVCWYVALMAWAIDKTKFEDVLNKNIEKLEKRYHGEFSTEKSINRKEDSNNSCEEKKNDSDNGFETFVKHYDEELDKMRINCKDDCDFEFETTLSDEAWHKLVRYFENEADTQEECDANQSNEDEEKDSKKMSDDDTKIKAYKDLKDMLDAYYNVRWMNDLLKLLFDKKDNKEPSKEEPKTINDLRELSIEDMFDEYYIPYFR
jgi:hypothetical protein